MKKTILTVFFALAMLITSNAQDYNTGIGIRGGLYNGLTVKHFISGENALEGLFLSRWGGFNITGLYEIHANAFNTPRLNWYYGFGGHIGFWDGDKNPWFDDNNNYTVIGVDGIIGLEYNIEAIPFNISLDWKPAINLIGKTNLGADEVALSVRFIF